MNVPALTVNKVCLSGLDAIALADQLIRAGEFDIVVAGGQESMTNAPHLLPKSREGYKYGAIEMLDSMAHDGLTDAFEDIAMGESTEKHNTRLGIGRAAQDEFAALSHQRAAAAQKNGLFEAEITPVEIPQRKGDPVVFSKDEGIRADTTAESLGKLRPAFAKDGTITAGHLLADLRRRRRGGRDEQGEGRGAGPGVAGGDRRARQCRRARTTPCSPSRPTPSSTRWARRASAVSDLDLIEINEAFAAVAVQSMKDLGVSTEKVNVNGGAIALGHPIGMSGARLVLHLALELKRRGGGIGAAALCGGGGQGDALIVRVPKG